MPALFISNRHPGDPDRRQEILRGDVCDRWVHQMVLRVTEAGGHVYCAGSTKLNSTDTGLARMEPAPLILESCQPCGLRNRLFWGPF